MAVIADLSEEERYLIAILMDQSAVDSSEFLWTDETSPDGVYRCWDFQVPMYRCDEKFQADKCGRAIGKALWVGTPIATPLGWTTMGQLRAGDVIFDDRGHPTTVVRAYEVRVDRPCFRVEFDDGSELIADADHEWLTWDKRARRSWTRNGCAVPRIRTTVEIADSLWAGKEANHSIPLTAPLHLTERELPLDPYFLGYWLGDGNSDSSKVTTADVWVVDELRRRGFVVTKIPSLPYGYSVQFPGVDKHTWKTSSVTAALRRLGLLKNKHIPMEYLRASEEQRRQLLAGLMDSDGHIKGDCGCELTQKSDVLAAGVAELLRSLGERPTVTQRPMRINGVDVGICSRVSWRPTSQPALLPRKAAVWRPLAERSRLRMSQRRIRRVIPVSSVPVRCIEVDSPSHLYLAGEGMIPTHNSNGIQMRAFAFPFTNPGEEMLLTAPEMIHLDPVTRAVERRLMAVRLSREMLKTSGTSSGFTHRPFEATFRNGARIVGRIPQMDGKGVKGMHPLKLEIDESQDYPEPGWVELGETLKFGNDKSQWRAHGVSRGVRDRFFKITQPGSGWYVHRITAMHREDWSPEQRAAKAEMYGSREHADYKRNILGEHGDASSSLFVLHRLMAQCDQDETSEYNTQVYRSIRINDEQLRDSGADIAFLLDFPKAHEKWKRFWCGMDVGMTNHPTEILVFGEDWAAGRGAKAIPEGRLRLLLRVHLERISAPDQRKVMEAIYRHYRPQGFGMDRTGLGLPIFSEIATSHSQLGRVLRGYNFSEKIAVGRDYREGVIEHGAEDDPQQIMANVLEYSSDVLRELVDSAMIYLPWDIELLREFQGQSFTLAKGATDAYGRRRAFNKGSFHALDAARMAAIDWKLAQVDLGGDEVIAEVYDSFL